jgi:hypothetical protein
LIRIGGVMDKESCCIKCITSSHKSCNNTVPLDDLIGDVKSSVAMRRIEEELSRLISKTGTIIVNKKSSIHLIEDLTTDLKKDILLSNTPFSRIVDKRFSPFDTIVSSSFKHKNTCKFEALSFILAMVSLRF